MGARRGRRTEVSYAALAAMLAAVGLLGGCTDGPDVDVSGSWVLVSGRTADGPLTIEPDSRVSLVFEEGGAGGKGPCNDYGSTYAVHGDELDFTGEGGISMTLVGCEGAEGALEAAYLSGLGDVDTVTRDGDVLTLTSDDTELVFDRMPSWPREDVVGHTWWLESWTDDTGTVHAARWQRGQRPFLRLELKGRNGGPITARSGCQTMTGHWVDWRYAPAIARGRFKGSCLHALTEQERAMGSMLSEPLIELRDRPDGLELVVRNAHGTDPTHLVLRR